MKAKDQILHSPNGFTLLEIIISITILSFLMLGVYYLTENSTEGTARTTREDLAKMQIEAALNRIEQDFSRIYTPLYYKAIKGKKGEQPTELESMTEEFPSFETNERFPAVTKDNQPIPAIKSDSPADLLFLSAINQRKIQNAKESHFVWIKYMLRDSLDENRNSNAPFELIRYYIPSDIYAPDFDFEKIRPSVLLSNIKKLEFKFWNSSKKEFADDFKTPDTPYLLRAIKVELITVDAKNIEAKFERIYRSIWPIFDPRLDEESSKRNPQDNNIDDENQDNED
ncbi:MAG: hypothetical protein A2202_03980 [Bdellovibrionales bacterium RIFOXYA1_FULL_36_14]|nr:MAG: hypothetical protein A2202_03980 [Bdellovibrionales bacterium RIFOXYA1_FULL_36_14]